MSAGAVRDLDLDLDAFEGPFDLLLTLVLKDELALSEIEVAEIIVTFVEQALAETPTSVEACGEFLILAAALLELKARDLFAGEGGIDLDDLDPDEAAAELAERLAEYRRFKAAAGWLEDRLEAESDRFFRLGPAPLATPAPRRIAPEDPQRLAGAIRTLAAEPPAPSLAHLALELPPVLRFLERFKAVLRRRHAFVFDEEVDGLSRLEQAVALLALLELYKEGEARFGQAEPFAPITVDRGRDPVDLAIATR